MYRLLSRLVITVTILAASAAVASAQTVLVMPYVQPGDGRTLLGTDVRVIHWLTDQTPGNFVVEVEVAGRPLQTLRPVRLALDFPAPKPVPKKKTAPTPTSKGGTDSADKTKKAAEKMEPRMPLPPEGDRHYFKYTAHLTDLPFNTPVHYRVKLPGCLVRAATFQTRSTADRSVRCILVGDMAQGRYVQRALAYQMSRWRPDFLVALGDIVYPSGRVHHYMGYFWGTYNNVAEPGLDTGAPLMAEVPFYPVLGNHDIGAKLATTPDALAVYHFFTPPTGGPGEGPWATPLGDDEGAVARFRALTTDSYPYIDAYSFDYGPAHFVVLNDNRNLKITAPAFQNWLRVDLKKSTAAWKFVCFHVPGFHSSKQHYAEQQTRLLQPIFEECGVNMTFAGHVHNYQRSVPLKFVPEAITIKRSSRVNGEFILDKCFDGICNTRPTGVIHVVAGGGGASLYGPGLDKTAGYLHQAYGSNYADFTARLVADEHSFVVLDIAPQNLELRTISAAGRLLDRILVTR